MCPRLTCGLRFLCFVLEKVPVSLSPPSSFPRSPKSALSLALKWSAEAVLGTWLAALLGGLPPLSWTPKKDGTASGGQAVEGVDGKGWNQK